jgi:excisionase family DNA binding protein
MQTTIETLRESASATITRGEAAAVLGVDPRTVSAGIREGNIPSIKIGRRVLIPRVRFLSMFDAAA